MTGKALAGVPPPLRDIGGPSAFGKSPRRFFRLLWFQSKLDFRLRYHGSVLGIAWALLNPLLMFGVLYLVFGVGFRLRDDVPHFGPLLLMNWMLVHFFIEGTSGAMHSVLGREAIVRKTQFPRSIVPFSVVATSCLQLAVSVLVLIGFILLDGISPMSTWALFLPTLVVLVTFTVGIGLLLSIVVVYLRDVIQIWGVMTRGLIFLTPIFWVAAQMPEWIREILLLNPLAVVFTQNRQWIIDPSAPTTLELVPWWTLVLAIGFLIVPVLAGFWLFVRHAPKVAEVL